MSSLKNKTISGVFWSMLQKLGDQGIQFVITIVLARLLVPEDFGLIGMLAIFIAISQTIVEAGFNKALIRKKDADEEDYSTVFFINLSVSVLLYLLLYFCAPFIAQFYNEPKLISLTRILSLIFILNAFGYVQETKLIKEMQFKRLMIINLPSTVISGIVAIVLAYNDFGVWSIVGQRLTMRFMFIIQVWFYSNWKPIWVFNKEKAKKLFAFGGNLMIVGIIQTIYLNGYKLVIGKFYPTSTLGYYENANSVVSAPISVIASVMSRVTFSVFSTIQNDDRKLKTGYKKSIQQILFVLCPFLVFSMVLAEPLFRFVLTEKWLPAVPFFQILCIGFIFRPLNLYNIDILNVKGHSGLFLRLDILKKVIETIGIAVSIIYFDIWTLIWFQSLFTIGKYIINSYYAGQFIDYKIGEQLKDISGIILISSIVGVLIFLISNYLIAGVTDIILIIGGYSLAGIFYWILVKYTKLNAYQDFINLIKPITTKLFNKIK